MDKCLFLLRRRQKIRNHCGYLRKKGVFIRPQELIKYLPKNYVKGDVLCSRDGSWELNTLCWKSKEWFYLQKAKDGCHLYKSGDLWYSKKHKGVWRTREDAVQEIS